MPQSDPLLDLDAELDLRLVRWFLIASRYSDLDSAARDLDIDTETLERGLSALEDIVGARLLTSHHPGSVMTAAGSALSAYGSSLLRDAAVAHRVAGQAVTGALTIGTGPYVDLGECVSRYLDAHPGTIISETGTNQGEQLASLQAGTIDVAVVRMPIEAIGIEVVPLLDDPTVVILPASHRLTTVESVHETDLAQNGLQQYTGIPDGPGWRKEQAAWKLEDWERTRDERSWNIELLLDRIVGGDGVLVLPRSLSADLDLESRGLVAKEVVDAPAYRLGLAMTADQTLRPEVNAFVEIVQDNVGVDQPAPWRRRGPKLPHSSSTGSRSLSPDTTGLPLVYQDSKQYNFPQETWRWINVRRYSFEPHFTSTEALTSLIAHPYFAHTYTTSALTDLGHYGEAVHGWYLLDALGVSNFIPATAVAAIATLDAFLAWGHPAATRAGVGVQPLVGQLEAATEIFWLAAGRQTPRAPHHGLGEFKEFVAFTTPGELLDIVLGED